MDTKRKLFTLPIDLCEVLEKQSNQSGTVQEALRLYFKSKDSAKRVVALAEKMEVRYNDYVLSSPQVTVGYENPVREYTYTMDCCITNRPDPETQIVPCRHWNRTEEGYRHFSTGEEMVL